MAPQADITSFTPEQKTAFNRAEGIGSGVDVTDTSAPVKAAADAPVPATGGTDPFLAELQKQLLGTSGLISSGQSQLQDSITEAIGGVQKGQEASTARIESQFGREREFQAGQFAQQRTAARESQRGFATNRAALQQMDERTEKSLRDLDQRKQELILAGESASAGRISELQFQALEFQQQAQQQAFNNLLGAGQLRTQQQQLQNQVKQEARLQSAQEIDAKLQQEMFDFQKITSLEDQRQQQQTINLRAAELKLKQVAEGIDVQPDPGFSSVSVQNQTGVQANTLLAGVQAKVDNGFFRTQEEEEAATIDAYMELRRVLSKEQVEDDALAQTFGLQFDEVGELGFIGGQIDDTDVPLPGENTGPFANFELPEGGLGSQLRNLFGADNR